MADTLHIEVDHDPGAGEWVAVCDEHPRIEGYGTSAVEALAHLAEQLGSV